MTTLFERDSKFERVTKAEDGDLIVDLAMASEIPYERWWGIEVLAVNSDAVDLSRLNDGAAVLFNHNWDDLRGVHIQGTVRADGDKVLRGKVRLESSTQRGKDTVALVKTGVLTKSSVGYSIQQVIEKTKTKDGREIERNIDGASFERLIKKLETSGENTRSGFSRELDRSLGVIDRAEDQVPTYIVTKWIPHENSLVTIPADPTVGIGRIVERVTKDAHITAIENTNPDNSGETKAEPEARETRASSFSPPASSTTAQPAISGGTTVSDVTQAPAGSNAEPVSAVQAERERRDAIIALCKSNKIDSRVEARWIEDGTPLTKVASELLDVMEERGRARPAAASELGLSRAETNRYSLFRAIRAMKFGSSNSRLIEEAAFELECSRAVAKSMNRELTSSILVPAEILQRPLGEAASRAMAATPGSKGGYLVNVENMGFIDILRNRSVALSMGSRQISGLQGNVVFPRQTGKGTVTWQGGEGANNNAADQTLGQLSMTPKTAIAITDVSEQLLRQSSISAEQFVMADLARDVAIDGVDYCVINGTGGAQPLGIKNTTGITSGQDASSATYAKILAFVSTAGAANAIRGNPGFVTNTTGAAKLMTVQRFASTDTPVWEGNMLDGELVKFKAMSSEQLASGNLIFGSWDEVVIGDWGVLELAMDNGGTRFNQAQVGIRAMWMVDVMIRYPQAFVVSTNLS